MTEKIKPIHVERGAYVYVRQSSIQQVRHHKEGQRRQYALVKRAEQLGFSRVCVVDDDMGRSGSGHQERPGFGRLLAAVCQGIVGAVFSLEASRLARNNRDWHHLIDLCALTDTLLLDEDGIYDPASLNDRLLLGLKGTMSEFELSLFKQRAQEARKQKIARGCVMWELPVGFVRTEDDGIEVIADRQVQEAIRGVFAKFRQLGSARQVTLWYREEQIPLPEVTPGTRGYELKWRLPTSTRTRQILSNPTYAGAFAWGKTGTRTQVRDGRGVKSRGKKSLEDWMVLILEHHSGYISWDEYMQNQKTLKDNIATRTERSGAAKNGCALLSGLIRCGRCGRMLHVLYSGTGGRVPRYICQGGRTQRGSASCLSLGALCIDRQVSRAVLEAIEPAGIEAALLAAQQASDRDNEKRKALELALEKARYQAERARRQYDCMEPENRLVAAELETRWNKSLKTVAELESRLYDLDDCVVVTDSDRERLLELGDDLQNLWNHQGASATLKKRILRVVLKEIIINVAEDASWYILHLHWAGGVHTQLRVPRNGTGQHRHVTDRDVVDLVRELAKVCTDQQIAAVLNRLGYKTGKGNTWRSSRVFSLRNGNKIPSQKRSNEWLTLQQTAQVLQVSNRTVERLIKQEVLPARQVVQCAPWVIERRDLARSEVKEAIRAIHERRKRPPASDKQRQFSFKFNEVR